MIYMLKGELQVAFVEETGGTRGAIVNDISAGDSTFFPKGLVHYQQNLGCEEASYVAAVNSEDPGVVFVLPTFFSLPGDAIEVRELLLSLAVSTTTNFSVGQTTGP
ncbi:unnamed protein product, partial [Scytosiphon promiscuus]